MSLENVQPEAVETTPNETHEAVASGPLSSLGINQSLFIFQFINFAIVAAIIWFLILKPLTKKMSERQKMIDESIENSKKIADNLKNSEQKFEEKINEAKNEAGKILDKASLDSEKAMLDMKEKAKKEIEILASEAKRNIKSEKEEMLVEVKKYAGELVVAALEKVLSEKITDKKDKELIDEMIKKVK